MGLTVIPPNPLHPPTMAIPDAVKEKVGEMPDVSAMSKDDLAALVKKMYDNSCAVFGEKFDMEYQVEKMDMEIHNLEMETSESHGSFSIKISQCLLPAIETSWQSNLT